MSEVDEVDQDEAPFVYVGRKSRRASLLAGNRHGKSSNSNGHGGVSKGFTYSSKTANIVSEKKAIQRAESNVDLFCDFLRCSEVRGSSKVEFYSTKLRAVLERVWSHDSDNDGESVAARPSPRRIVCLGLGSPMSSRSAQIQLALLIVIREVLVALAEQTETPAKEDESKAAIECLAFDPVFTPDDAALMHKHGIRTLESASETDANSATNRIAGYYTNVDRPTLLFMPHCDRSLYEDVLTANNDTNVDTLSSALESSLTLENDSQISTSGGMPNITLLANTLTNYLDAAPRKQHSSIPTLSRLASKMHAVALPNWLPSKVQQVGQIGQLWDTRALNEMSFQWM